MAIKEKIVCPHCKSENITTVFPSGKVPYIVCLNCFKETKLVTK